MFAVEDLHWLAGLWEGEGTFTRHPQNGVARMSLQMTDRDVVAHAAQLLGARLLGPYKRKTKPSHYKELWQIDLYRDPAIHWIIMLYPLLGERRQARIRQLLDVPGVKRVPRRVPTHAE